MPTIYAPDAEAIEEVIAERKARGLDRYDEVWEGEYVIMNVPANRHQKLVTRLSSALLLLVDEEAGDFVLSGANVSDRMDWQTNYRVPDVLVYRGDSPAEDHGTFYLGGPDLAVEVVSPNDRTYEKLDFYAAVGTRELIVIDKSYERLELYRLLDGVLTVVGTLTPDSNPIATESIPLQWTLERIYRLRLVLTGRDQTRSVLID